MAAKSSAMVCKLFANSVTKIFSSHLKKLRRCYFYIFTYFSYIRAREKRKKIQIPEGKKKSQQQVKKILKLRLFEGKNPRNIFKGEESERFYFIFHYNR